MSIPIEQLKTFQSSLEGAQGNGSKFPKEGKTFDWSMIEIVSLLTAIKDSLSTMSKRTYS